MADQGVSGISSKTEQEPIKKKRTFPKRIAERSRKAQATRRACTPDPGLKAWTDDSEKDVSDAENVARSREIARRRTRSAERSKTDEPDTEEDFEVIRSLHKRKELEEEAKPAATSFANAKPKEEVRVIPKELPPLIVAPPELKKRARHKSQVIAELVRKQVTTSEEEDEKQVSKPRKSPESRKLRRIPRKEKTEAPEVEEKLSESQPEKEKIEKEEEVKEKSTKRWFWWGTKKEKTEAPEVEEKLSESQSEKENIEKEEEVKEKGTKKWFWWGRKKEKKEEEEEKKEKEKEEEVEEVVEKKAWLPFRMVQEWKVHVEIHGVEYDRIKTLKNKCFGQLLLMMLYCGFGGIMFRFVEGAFETFYKCGVKRVKRDFIDSLWSYSQYMHEEDWKSQARRKLMDFENQLHTAHEAGMTTYSGQKSWSFLNSVVYCLTVITTIGYGHISPSTTTGRAITIIYAIFGIPMFLILLADFGKLFTRGIKFLWAFVRRLYYTGSCKKVRRTAPVQEVMKGVQFMYDFAKNRRGSQWDPNQSQNRNQLPIPEANIGVMPETPGTPNMSAFEIDDEFNLPISVAITILLIYIFVGATIYWMWEEWSFFESFYFVFISMSTIGFGDFVPQNPVYMMASIIYLVFGLALTSMCINVVQEKLSDTFRQASTKIGATIGLRVAEDGTLSAPPELADVNPMDNMQ